MESTRTNEDMDAKAETSADIRTQLVSYSSQIQQYLQNVEAKIDDYKLSIEKKEDGLAIDCAIKAKVLMKDTLRSQ